MNLMAKANPPLSGAEALCSRVAEGELLHTGAGARQTISWALPEEVPVALQINSEPYTVMMATPADLRDFAIGFLLAEGLVTSPSAIKGVLVMPVENGFTADVAVDESAIIQSRRVNRSVEGRTGCGLCGVEDIADAIKTLRPVARTTAPSTEAILKAAAALPALQPMNQFNHTVHAAAWVSPEGDVKLVREDVGRHNALDKLIGAMAAAGTDVRSGFIIVTSRCSFELVQKCAFAGIGALVSVSAPTALALDLARGANIFLGALARGAVAVFNP
jgi:FdhD protein